MISKLEFHAMGSGMLAALEGTPQEAGILQQVPVWFAEWEQIFSRFIPDSELNRLNRNNGRPFPVSSPLWELLGLSLENARNSEGLISPAILDQLELAGYDRSFEQIQHHAVEKYLIPADEPCLDEVVLDETTHTVTLPRHLRLDLGGVAKGWAAQQAMLRLSAVHPAMVDAGGDIAISGPLANGDAWPVGVRDPFHPGNNVAYLGLKRSCVATSGTDYHRWMLNGSWQHHLIDPRTGSPADTDLITATVIAPDVMAAEMAAKMVLILGSKNGKEWLEQQPGEEGLLIHEDGTLIPSRGWKEQLWSNQ